MHQLDKAHDDKQGYPPPKMSAPLKEEIRSLIDEVMLAPEDNESPPSNLNHSVLGPQ